MGKMMLIERFSTKEELEKKTQLGLRDGAHEIMQKIVERQMEEHHSPELDCARYHEHLDLLMEGMALALVNLHKLLEPTHRGTGVDLMEYCDGKPVAIVEVEK